jgi:hypothetical protein
VEPDTHGEIQNTQFTVGEKQTGPRVQDREPTTAPPAGLGKLEAMEQAGEDVTKVFKVGKGFRFSVYDHASGQWQDSPLIASRAEAERLRQEAFKARFEALQQGRH